MDKLLRELEEEYKTTKSLSLVSVHNLVELCNNSIESSDHDTITRSCLLLRSICPLSKDIQQLLFSSVKLPHFLDYAIDQKDQHIGNHQLHSIANYLI